MINTILNTISNNVKNNYFCISISIFILCGLFILYFYSNKYFIPDEDKKAL